VTLMTNFDILMCNRITWLRPLLLYAGIAIYRGKISLTLTCQTVNETLRREMSRHNRTVHLSDWNIASYIARLS